MKRSGLTLAILLCMAPLTYAQESSDFRPASTNVWDAQYPRVDSKGRVEIRIKAPDAAKVRLNFWSGPKIDMEKQAGRLLDRHHASRSCPACTTTR